MTLNLKLTRMKCMDDRTIGRLDVGDMFQYWTLEDAVREIDGALVEQWKIPGETAIPKGIYKIILDFSNRFKKVLPRLLDVPGFAGVRIHSGNTPEDTEGCILIGKAFDEATGNVINSRLAMTELMYLLESTYDSGTEIELEIR